MNTRADHPAHLRLTLAPTLALVEFEDRPHEALLRLASAFGVGPVVVLGNLLHADDRKPRVALKRNGRFIDPGSSSGVMNFPMWYSVKDEPPHIFGVWTDGWGRATSAGMKWKIALAIAAVLVGGSIVAAITKSSDWILHLGVFFEVLGLWKTVANLNDSAKAFGKPGFLTRLFGPSSPRVVEGSGSAAIGPFTVQGYGRVFTPVVGTPTVEQRLKALEDRAEEFQGAVIESKRRDHEIENKLDMVIGAEKAERQRVIAEVRAKLEEVTVGGLDDEYPWLMLLLGGLILTNYNDKIARWFGGI